MNDARSPAGDAIRRAEFREWVRAHHPDVGGDPEVFKAGLQRWRAGPPGTAGGAGVQVAVFRSRGGWWLVARWWQRRHRAPRVR